MLSARSVLVALAVAATLATAGCGAHQTPAHAAGPGSRAAAPSASAAASAYPLGDDRDRPMRPPPDPYGFRARLPHFGAPLPPEKIPLPDGPAAPIFLRLPVQQPVAFLTIDDGYDQHPEAIALLKAAHVPVTLFLISTVAAGNPGYFGQLRDNGAVIEAHTLTHPSLKGLSYDFQRHQICGSADQLGSLFGRRPVLFRPPYGDYDHTTLIAAHDCGMHAVFYWSETVNTGIVRYQAADQHVHAGDIILMHFRPAYVDDFIAALQAIHDAGLTPALLENYIP